ncbi:DDE-type integrase/transposase/recombinase [Tahibacter amnicola]|uniref:DDE-type integrase/transposase/recombinase n=1 Tax=Tahibacter amnicola TaxID=2976241 RepID=A0ABY6BIL7_9GAMM|nr:DDE-type integrase/transposase/recombinase [Tahibacter amnicola]UXI68215.1 DDE-type integrase/transposase/recombinase [Tahibacter amnicola]
MIEEAWCSGTGLRLKQVLAHMGIAASSWYHRPAAEQKRPGPAPRPLDEGLKAVVLAFAHRYPWWGYKRLAIVMRRAGEVVSKKFVYAVFKAEKLLQRRRATSAELHQSAKLFDLLPTRPNALWQADVTYLHIPGHGWWYAVTVIDYYSRYLLALHLTSSYSAPQINRAIDLAMEEAQRIHGKLEQTPFLVTDNGSSFLAKRFQSHIKGQFSHVRTRYRTPQQLGLLERFHQTLKREEVYWQLYDSPQDAREKLSQFHVRYNTIRPHWALMPAAGGDELTPHDVYAQNQAVVLPKWQGWAKAARKKLDEALAHDASLKLAA